MNATLLALSLVAFSPAQKAERERHPLAPSLPLLTEKEYAAVERIIDRFIEHDIGKLKGAAGAKAVADFKALGPEAIPPLLEGLNRAANMENSCPAVLIAKKLAQLLNGSDDEQLLDFARDMIGAGVTAKRHTVVLKDLRITCQLRKAAVQRRNLAFKGNSGAKAPRAMTLAELAAAAGSERGPRLKLVLTELGQRQGERAIQALGAAAGTYDGEIREHARKVLLEHLARQGAAVVKARLKDDRAEVRAAAARTVGTRKLRFGAELIDLLSDSEESVRQAARQALVQLSRGQDHGPRTDATEEELSTAVRNWRAWWDRQGGK